MREALRDDCFKFLNPNLREQIQNSGYLTPFCPFCVFLPHSLQRGERLPY